MMKGARELMNMVAMSALMFCCTSTFAAPIFESASIVKESTHCNAEAAPAAIAPDGRAMFVAFNYMRIKVRSGTDHARCDVTLKLSAPLDAPETVQMDVILQSLLSEGASASATVEMLGHKQALNLDAQKNRNDVLSQRVTANLPKGAQQLDIIFELSIKGGVPDSSSLISIDELDVGDMAQYRN